MTREIAQRPVPGPHHPPGTKVSHALAFEGGSLTVRQQGYGEADGNGHFAFDEKDLRWEPHEEDGGAHIWLPVARSELLFLRDKLNELFPPSSLPSVHAEMLAALKAAERAIDDCQSYRSHLHHKELDQVRAAIAKATGSEG